MNSPCSVLAFVFILCVGHRTKGPQGGVVVPFMPFFVGAEVGSHFYMFLFQFSLGYLVIYFLGQCLSSQSQLLVALDPLEATGSEWGSDFSACLISEIVVWMIAVPVYMLEVGQSVEGRSSLHSRSCIIFTAFSFRLAMGSQSPFPGFCGSCSRIFVVGVGCLCS